MPPPLAAILGVGPLIGLAVARRFASEGFRTALVGVEGAFLAEQAVLLPRARAFECRLEGEDSVRELFERLRREVGEPEVLVYNASAGSRGAASGLAPSTLERELKVNAIAPLAAVREVLPAMRRAKRGTLLFTGGGLALKPQADLASGSLGKAALRQLALCLAEELAPEGIHAATVTVAGYVQRASSLDPDRIAEHFWQLHAEPRDSWRSEVVLRS